MRDILLFTDGSVTNTAEVINLCKTYKSKNRIFSIGIGSGCSTGLVDGISQATNGKAFYVKCENRIETKVMQLVDFSTQQTFTIDKLTFNIPHKVGRLDQISIDYM